MAKTNYLHWLSAPWEPRLLTEGWLELELAGDRAHMIQTQQRQRSEITRPTRSNSHWNRQRVPTSPTYLQQDPLWAELHFHIATKRKVPAYTNCFQSLSLQPPSESSKWADRCSGAVSNLNFSQQKTLKHGISTNSLAFLKSIWVSSVSCLIFLQRYKQTAQHLRALYSTTVLQIPKGKVNPNSVHLYCTQEQTQRPVITPQKRGLVPRILKILYCAKFVAHLPMFPWDNGPHILEKRIAFPQISILCHLIPFDHVFHSEEFRKQTEPWMR